MVDRWAAAAGLEGDGLMPDPWVAIEATVRRNGKLASLPSDVARWGWVVMLGEAKLLRRAGTFTPAQWPEAMGRFARYLDAYLSAGLLHRAPRYCDQEHQRTCLRGRGPFPAGTLVIHEWPSHQREHAVRQAVYRSKSDADSDVRSDAGSDAGSDARSDGGSDISSRALSPSLSMSRSSPNGEEPYQGGADPADVLSSWPNGEGSGESDPEWPIMQWLARDHHVAIRDGGGYHVRLVRLVEAHGAARVRAAIQRCIDEGSKGERALIFGAENVLDPPHSPRRESKLEREERELAEAKAALGITR